MDSNQKKQFSRRIFLNKGLKMAATLPLFSNNFYNPNCVQPNQIAKAVRPLKILILGGTSFLGPHQIAYAMSRGHSITTFTRGKTKPTIYQDLFKEVEQLIGDREDNLNALKGRSWDAVIDNSGHRVKWTRDSAQSLKEAVGLYLYTSSTGVYYPYLGSDIKEDTQLVCVVPENLNQEQEIEYGYGVMKTNSEFEVRQAFGLQRTIIVRPTYMMGPADRSDRFTYWPVRLSLGGEVLVPGKANDPVQYIDVRDVAQWMIRLIENEKAGTFNAVGPVSPTGMHAFIYGVHAAFNSYATFVMIPDHSFLKNHSISVVVPWILPEGENAGSALVNNQHGISNGLTYRPLAESVRDIHNWWHSDAVTKDRREKMLAGEGALFIREKDILKAWKAAH